VPANTALPYTVRFENPAGAATHANEVRIVAELDEDLSARSFRLGDLKIGDITVNVPGDRAAFQGEFDLRNSKGFILRVRSGIDTAKNIASWVLQAIDPETGEVLADATRGLLAPGVQGFASFTAHAAFGAQTGAQIHSSARVLLDTQAPVDTSEIVRTLDAAAPTTTVEATPVAAGGADYDVRWSATDDAGGSGVKHTTVYVSEDGGDWKIWLRQSTETSAVYEGTAGKSYEFLALSTDQAGNREVPPPGEQAPDDGSRPAVGIAPQVGATTQDVGLPPAPSDTQSTNPLFTQAELGVPGAIPLKPSEFSFVVAPFSGASFGTGIPQSDANIGPLALLARPDGTFLASGGGTRSALYAFDEDGGHALAPLAMLDTPVFDLAYDRDGGLWATSGGGELLELDPETLRVLNRYGDSLTQSLALDPASGKLYVSSGDGIKRFDPVTRSFSHFSNVRVDDLAVGPGGKLWGTSWPGRGDVLTFDARGRAQVQVRLDAPVDSIAFGRDGTQLAGLLFVSSKEKPATVGGASLWMVDVATLRMVELARNGPGAEQLVTTDDGRLLVGERAPHRRDRAAGGAEGDRGDAARRGAGAAAARRDRRGVRPRHGRVRGGRGELRAQARRRAARDPRGALRRGAAHRVPALRRARAGRDRGHGKGAHREPRRPDARHAVLELVPRGERFLGAGGDRLRRDALRPADRHRVIRRARHQHHRVRPARAAHAGARPGAVLRRLAAGGDALVQRAVADRPLARRPAPRPRCVDRGADHHARQPARAARRPRLWRLRAALSERRTGF
jgi:hypothetical protein